MEIVLCRHSREGGNPGLMGFLDARLRACKACIRGHEIFSSIPGLPTVTQKRHHDLPAFSDMFIRT